MAMKNEIKACIILNLEKILDPYLADHGFKRAKPSLVYKRKSNGSTQTIDFALQIHPKDRPDSAAAIYPQVEVAIPSVDSVLHDIVGDNLGLLEGVTGGRTKQPIGFTSEKCHPGRWFIFQPDSISGVVEDIKIFMETWTISFLDGYTTPEDVLAADKRKDGRLARDRAQIMRVVAAAVVLNDTSYALAILEKWFAPPALQRRYQKVFEYIQR